MENAGHVLRKVTLPCAAGALVLLVIGFVALGRGRVHANDPGSSADSSGPRKENTSEGSVTLSPGQLATVKVEPVSTYLFPVDRETVGTIDYDGDVSVQVFPPYQGTIIDVFAELGSDVRQDQPLYTIKSPDLIQAESTLIGAAASFELTSRELTRAKGLVNTSGVSEREVEQATSDQQTAEGALKAARDAVHVFGKTDAEIDQMIASRHIDPALVVHSPIAGRITAKNAQTGFLVQPGSAPAPYSVADVTRKWMLATVPEAEIAAFHLGQPVQVRVMAYPEELFKGRVSKIYETVDPNTHRVTVRSEISDPRNVLRPGMLANFVIRVQNATASTSIPANGVVREPDGSMTVWVTTDRQHFVPRTVQIGSRRDGRVQVLRGLQPGELVVTDGAVFLSNMLAVS